MGILRFLSSNKASVVLVCAGLMLLAGIAAGVYLQTLSDKAEEERLALSNRLFAVEESLNSLQEVQIAQAAFLITGKDSHGDRFAEATEQLRAKVTALQGLFANDAHNVKVIAELRRVHELKVAELMRAAEMQKSTGPEAARAMFMSRTSDDYGAAIRILLDHLKKRDRANYAAIDDSIRVRRKEVTAAAIGVFAFAAAFGLFAHISLRQEIVRRKALLQRMEHEATHDALTGLPNRRWFMQEIDRALARARRSGGMLAVLFIDLDGFKRINDELGHETGDALLQAVARKFAMTLRQSDMVARLGGDEFAVLADVTNQPALHQLAERLIAASSVSLIENHPDYTVSASIGFAVYPQDADDATSLLSRADSAMYCAKRSGKARAVAAQRKTGHELVQVAMPVLG